MWNTTFEGLKIHVLMYGIIAYGIPMANLDSIIMDNTKIIKQLEAENNIKPKMIVKITPLRCRKNCNSVKLHHSIVIYINYQHTVNRCIANSFHVYYFHYAAERFTL